MKMIKFAIVEDERAAIDILISFLDRYAEQTGQELSFDIYNCGSEMLMKFQSQYDIVLMDVQMPGMDGMETAKMLRKTDGDFCLIFITNMASVAINGYEVNAMDFLVKPITYFQFYNAIKKAINFCKKNLSSSIMINTSATEKKKIYIKNLLYVEVYGHILNFHTFDGVITIHYVTMKEIEKELTEYGFARCNNCYLVNMRYISAIDKDSVTINGTELKMSKTRRNQFMRDFTKFMGGGTS